jgi:quercetin dioxygenase-like cupin family protein
MAEFFSMKEAFADQLVAARKHREGRSSVSLHEGEASVLRQTVTALQAGKSMEIEHPPLEGWILVLEGELSLRINGDRGQGTQLPTGSLIQLPHEPMTLSANVDSGILLTSQWATAPGDRQ